MFPACHKRSHFSGPICRFELIVFVGVPGHFSKRQTLRGRDSTTKALPVYSAQATPVPSVKMIDNVPTSPAS
jgi:hypothetical protein